MTIAERKIGSPENVRAAIRIVFFARPRIPICWAHCVNELSLISIIIKRNIALLDTRTGGSSRAASSAPSELNVAAYRNALCGWRVTTECGRGLPNVRNRAAKLTATTDTASGCNLYFAWAKG